MNSLRTLYGTILAPPLRGSQNREAILVGGAREARLWRDPSPKFAARISTLPQGEGRD